MSNLPALNNSLTIQTVDGQSIDLANFNPLDYVAPSSSGKPLYRLTAGQPRDLRYPEASNQLFLTRKLREDGQTRQDNVGPLGTEIEIFPLAVWANRSLMPKYTENSSNPDANKPLCHSESFIAPDAQFMGTYATQCCALDRQTGRVIAVCPMAKWGEKDPQTGKSTPPACSESYILFAAIQLDTPDGPQAEVIEIYFSRSSATNGKNITQKLRTMQQQGVAIWEFPIKLVIKPAGPGNTIEGSFLNHVELEDADAEGMIALSARAEDAIRIRKERALRLPEQSQAEDEIPFDTTPTPTQPAQSAQTVTKPAVKATTTAAAPNGNGKAKRSLI